MKKIRLFAMLVLVASLVLSLASCFGGVDGEGMAEIVIEYGENNYAVYTVDLEKIENKDNGAVGVFEYLAGVEDSDFTYVLSGTWLSSVCDLVPGDRQYISIYTSVEEDFAVATPDWPVNTVEYDGGELTASGVGLDSMHVTDGAVILFRMESY